MFSREVIIYLRQVGVVSDFARDFNVLTTGGGCKCFREGFKCTCDRWRLYRFYRAWKILRCDVLGLLEVFISAILCHGPL